MDVASVVGRRVVVIKSQPAAGGLEVAARPEKLRVAFQEFDLEFRRGCRSAELADETAAEP